MRRNESDRYLNNQPQRHEAPTRPDARCEIPLPLAARNREQGAPPALQKRTTESQRHGDTETEWEALASAAYGRLTVWYRLPQVSDGR
jgi:hypothetical protein